MLKTIKTKGFTLAEVLVTLAIMGVVSAMTVPTLIVNHDQQAYDAKGKKALSTTANAYKKMLSYHGVFNTSDLPAYYCGTDSSCVSTEYRRVMNIIKDSTSSSFAASYCHDMFNGENFCGDYTALLADGTLYTHVNMENGSSNNRNLLEQFNVKENILQKMFMSPVYAAIPSKGWEPTPEPEPKEERYVYNGFIELAIAIDLNGGRKPNRLGKDIRVYNITRQGSTVDVTKECMNRSANNKSLFFPAAYAAPSPSGPYNPTPDPEPEPDSPSSSSGDYYCAHFS